MSNGLFDRLKQKSQTILLCMFDPKRISRLNELNPIQWNP